VTLGLKTRLQYTPRTLMAQGVETSFIAQDNMKGENSPQYAANSL